MTTHKKDLYEKLIDKVGGEDTHSPAVKKPIYGVDTLMSRIDTIKTSKEFLEECTYFIGLNGKFCLYWC